jgi:hypothetical protein
METGRPLTTLQSQSHSFSDKQIQTLRHPEKDVLVCSLLAAVNKTDYLLVLIQNTTAYSLAHTDTTRNLAFKQATLTINCKVVSVLN